MVLLDRLGVIDGEPWFETHIDTLSVQASLFHGAAVSWLGNLRHFTASTGRVEVTL